MYSQLGRFHTAKNGIASATAFFPLDKTISGWFESVKIYISGRRDQLRAYFFLFGCVDDRQAYDWAHHVAYSN